MIIAIKNRPPGFIALMSVIIISAVLLVMIVAAAAISFYTRFNVLDYENKKISVAMAEACLQIALLDLAQNPDYYRVIPGTAGQTVQIETGKTCKICALTGSRPEFIIETRAVRQKAYTDLAARVTLNGSDLTISSLSETPNSAYSSVCGP